LPDELLEERDRGNIVFFCGAGVSRPAGLPGFLDLALQVIEELQPAADAKSRLLLTRAQTDPAFAPPLDQVFSLLQQEYTAPVIEDVVSQLLATPRDADIAQHEIVLRLSRNAANKPQVVTTNFDLLFERADKLIAKHVPPALPDLASGQQPIGIVYLHGRRATRPTHGITRQGLILSSADFGRAYLADAWATRFARELLRSYVIVLLGYSANDPPVRYLLEGLHSRGHTTSSAIYAFDQGSDEEVAAGAGLPPEFRNRVERLWTMPSGEAAKHLGCENAILRRRSASASSHGQDPKRTFAALSKEARIR
jgi:hypothetical protein